MNGRLVKSQEKLLDAATAKGTDIRNLQQDFIATNEG